MPPSFLISENCVPYGDEIAQVTREAFAARYGTGDAEAKLIAALRADSAVVIERAALVGGKIAAHVMLSRVAADPPTRAIAALAPVSTRIDLQGQGIGTALIRVGLHACRAQGIDIAVVLGDPAYYACFGFTAGAGRLFDCPYSSPHFQALGVRDDALKGGPWRLTYPRAFEQA